METLLLYQIQTQKEVFSFPLSLAVFHRKKYSERERKRAGESERGKGREAERKRAKEKETYIPTHIKKHLKKRKRDVHTNTHKEKAGKRREKELLYVRLFFFRS